MNRKLALAIAVVLLGAMVFALAGIPDGRPSKAASKGLKVALVLSGGRGDRSFLDSAYAGAMMAKDKLPGVSVRVVEPSDPSEYEASIRAMARGGYDLIITIAFGMLDATNKVADQYPNVKFAIVDATSNRPNVASLVFKEHEGSYLVGVMAGMMTKTNIIGFVGGMDIPLIRRFQKGFEAGVKAVNPKAEVLVGYAGAFNDPGKGKELALAHYQRGADIVYHAAGKTGEGVIAAAKERNKYVIGVDSDQCYIAPNNMITSMMKRVDVAVFSIIKDTLEGKFKAGPKVYGLAENAVGPCQLYPESLDLSDHKDFPGLKAAIEKAKEYRDKILSGKIVVPDAMQMNL